MLYTWPAGTAKVAPKQRYSSDVRDVEAVLSLGDDPVESVRDH